MNTIRARSVFDDAAIGLYNVSIKRRTSVVIGVSVVKFTIGFIEKFCEKSI